MSEGKHSSLNLSAAIEASIERLKRDRAEIVKLENERLIAEIQALADQTIRLGSDSDVASRQVLQREMTEVASRCAKQFRHPNFAFTVRKFSDTLTSRTPSVPSFAPSLRDVTQAAKEAWF